MLKRHILTGLLLPVLMMSTLSAGASGGYLNGNKLYDYAKSYHRNEANPGANVQDLVNASYFLGYITAAADTFNTTEKFCVPKGVSSDQLADITYQYLRDNPDQRQYTASSNLFVALKHAFPGATCENKGY